MINPVLAELLVKDYEREIAHRARQQELLKLAADRAESTETLRRSMGRALVRMGNWLAGSTADEVRSFNHGNVSGTQGAGC